MDKFEPNQDKKPYVAPQLKKYGDVRVLTQTKSSGFNDFGPLQIQNGGGGLNS